MHLALSLVSGALFLALAWAMARDAHPWGLDQRAIDAYANARPGAVFWEVVAALGLVQVEAPLVLALAALRVRNKQPRAAATFAVLYGAGLVLVQLFKTLIGRPRPGTPLETDA